MSSDLLQRPIGDLEVAVFTTRVFQALDLQTFGDLVATTERGFLAKAEELAADRPDFPAKSLKEVKAILADMGLGLIRERDGS